MADIFINGQIDEFTESSVIDQIKMIASDEEIVVHINSVGGSVFSGYSIYNVLRSLPNRVVTQIDGLAASIASVIALAGDEVNISELSEFMIHDPLIMGGGNPEQLREQAEALDRIAVSIVDVYKNKTGLRKDTIRKMMRNETFLTSREAVSLGFADAIVNPLKAVALINPNMNILDKIRENAEALGITSKVKQAEDSAVEAVKQAAKEKAEKERLKAIEKAEGVDVLVADMVTKQDFEEFKAVVLAFIQASVDKFDSDLTNEQIQDTITDRVKASVNDLLKTVKSKAVLPKEGQNFVDGIEIKNNATPRLDGFNARLKQIQNHSEEIYR